MSLSQSEFKCNKPNRRKLVRNQPLLTSKMLHYPSQKKHRGKHSYATVHIVGGWQWQVSAATVLISKFFDNKQKMFYELNENFVK